MATTEKEARKSGVSGTSNRILAIASPNNVELQVDDISNNDPPSFSNSKHLDAPDQKLLWVILIGLIFALIIQSLAANLGVSTGKHLSEHCKAEYPLIVKYCLWILAEVGVIAADIPEVIGTAFALNILFHIPVWVGVLITDKEVGNAHSSISADNGACFFGEMSYVKPPANELVKGMFIPKLEGQGATADAIALLGALEACKYFLLESGFALFVAFWINVAIISVSATVCSSNNLTQQEANQCSDLTLNNASVLLQNVLGRKTASIFYGIALFASGQSSTITGTYAGQYIMQGFLDLKMKSWMRNLVTRCIAITPSLIVSIIGGSAGAGKLIIISSIIIVCWILGLGIIGINIYYLITAFVGWLMHNNLPKVCNVFVGIVVFPLMAIYILSIVYLMIRKDKVATFVDPAIVAYKEDVTESSLP
ncbi:Metal transporter Nramp5 [Bienertia sinuspersici]